MKVDNQVHIAHGVTIGKNSLIIANTMIGGSTHIGEMAVAEYVDKTLAICMRCGAPANRTQRLVASTDRVVVGGAHEYEARCRRCHETHAPRSEE